jgi:hypothetical protein
MKPALGLARIVGEAVVMAQERGLAMLAEGAGKRFHFFFISIEFINYSR